MLLNKETSKIKYIDFHFSESHTQFNEFIQVVDLGSIGPRGTMYNAYGWECSIIKPADTYGIWIGKQPNLENTIKSKINNNISVSDKLYFDANCKFPRFKLASKNMKRTIKINNADKIVLSKYTPTYYKTSSGWLKNVKPYLVYSPSEDTYYYMSNVRDLSYDRSCNKRIEKFNTNYKKYSSTGHQTELYDILKYTQIIPNDAFVLQDEVYLLNERDYKYIDNIINNYMQIIYDTELDKFICDGLLPIGEDDINTLYSMLSSNDSSIVGMGLKLLSSYDINSDPMAIVILLNKYWNRIERNDAVKSVGFQQVLTSLQINKNDLGRHQNKLMNQVFDACITEESKIKAREAVRQMVLRETQEFINKQLNALSRYELTYDLTIN